MRIQPFSFILGVGAALVIPLFSKVFRPLAVEAMAAGLGFLEEGRRVLAEQMEVMEDIAAEARARRETIIAAGNGVAHGTDKDLLLAHKAAIDRHLEEAGIHVNYTNVFWGGRSEIKPSEILPLAYRKWCDLVGVNARQ